MAGYSPIGIDVGTSDIKLAQLKRERKQWLPFAAVRQVWRTRSTDEPQFDDVLTTSLKAAYESHGFKGRRAIVTAPSCLIDVWPVKVPLNEGVDVFSFVQAEIAERRGQLTSEFVVDYWIAGETVEHGETKLEAYAVSASREKIVSLVKSIEAAGLCCTRIEIGATSLAHGVEIDESTELLLLDIGDRTSMLMAMDNMGITFCRDIKWGGGRVTAKLKQALDIDMETAEQIKLEWGIRPIHEHSDDQFGDAHPRQQVINDAIEQEIRGLALEIGRSLAYRVQSGDAHGERSLALVGGGSQLRGMDRFLQDALKLGVTTAPVRMHEALATLVEHEGQHDAAERFAIALGTAISGVN